MCNKEKSDLDIILSTKRSHTKHDSNNKNLEFLFDSGLMVIKDAIERFEETKEIARAMGYSIDEVMGDINKLTT